MKPRWCLPLLPLLFAGLALADGPGDNLPDKVRPIPKPGIVVPQRDRAELEQELVALGKDIESLRTALKSKPALRELLPDVEVFHKAVRYALQYHEFFSDAEIPVAKALLKQGRERAAALRDGQAPWATQTGLVVRGYVSKIDGSVQPYGLVVPASYRPDSPYKHRLDLWWHGRGETLSELNFINQRQRSPGEFTPRDAFVLHPYGRYSNANKFAGEIDTFEAMAHVQKHYRINKDRIVARGFSMGGAACWQFAVHYPGVWAAAAPGAGFSETADFLKVYQQEKLQPTWYEQKLWHLYDCTDYAVNLFNCPTVAYSGENDPQKQAADMMAKALEAEGIKLTHIIGKKAKHFYTPEAKAEINRRIDQLAKIGRMPDPDTVLFTTWTLRYNRAYWVRIEGLEKHWERAEVRAQMGLPDTVVLKTRNVSALTLALPPGDWRLLNRSLRRPAEELAPAPPAPQPQPKRQPVSTIRLDQPRPKPRGLTGPLVTIDGTNLDGPPVQSDRSWTVHLRKIDGKWKVVDSLNDGTLRKRHGLQGPIDDAFMDSFLMVRPTGKPQHEAVGKWVKAEMAHALDHWRRQFRGDARIKNDTAVSEADIANHNLVLWGDPQSNRVLAKIADKLPIRWNEAAVHVGSKKYDAGKHAPVLIYPNPLNPKRYLVVNSGFTYREYDYLNNARQVPKLPDWAVIDVSVPPSSRFPGRVADAGFFGEKWELTTERK